MTKKERKSIQDQDKAAVQIAELQTARHVFGLLYSTLYLTWYLLDSTKTTKDDNFGISSTTFHRLLLGLF